MISQLGQQPKFPTSSPIITKHPMRISICTQNSISGLDPLWALWDWIRTSLAQTKPALHSLLLDSLDSLWTRTALAVELPS